jgi:hypothetical protein
MIRLLLLIFLAMPVLAKGPKNSFDDSKLNDEFHNVYYDIENVMNYKTYKSSVTISNIYVSTLTMINPMPSSYIKGTTTNDSATAGRLGEIISASATGTDNATTTNEYDDLMSIDLTPGDWDVSLNCRWQNNGATWTSGACGTSAVSGNDNTGLNFGDNLSGMNFASSSTGVTEISLVVAAFRVSLSATTTYYLKRRAIYTAGTPRTAGARISARRVR